jgi:protein involved in polysaccharide export with SLBB domain
MADRRYAGDGFQCPYVLGSGWVFEKHIPFHSGLRLKSAIDKAGGLSGLGDIKSIRGVRAGQASKVDLRKIDPAGANHPLLQVGDLIFLLW